ncbi:MAG: PQQ-binding-like beta-propeller repeat protein [Acidimicrobiales bacterium]
MLGVTVIAALVIGAVVYLRRDRGPDQVWTPISGFETLPPGLADRPDQVWSTRLTPDGGLSLDLELSRRGAWALSQLQQEIVLTSIDLGDGEPLWESDVGGERSIAFELELFGNDDALALSFEPAAGQTHIALYRPHDGSTFWTEDSADSLFLVTEGARQPLLDGMAVFSVGPESVAVELSTGTERWRAPLYPLVREGRLLASTQSQTQAQDSSIAEVDPDDGSLRWETPVQIPLVANGVLYLIDDDEVAAVELGSGEELWTESEPGVIAPATDDSIAMVRDSEVVGLDAQSGDVLWRRPIDLRRLAVPTANPVIVDGERLLIVPGADRMFNLRGDDGSEMAWVSLPEDSSVLAFADGTAYIGAENEVFAYSLPDLEELWSTELDQPVDQLVAVDEGLLVATRDTLTLLAADGS